MITINDTDFHSAWSRAVRNVIREGTDMVIGDVKIQKPIRDACVVIELEGNAIRQIEAREIHPQFPFKLIDNYCKEFTYEFQNKYLSMEDEDKFTYTYFDRLVNYELNGIKTNQLEALNKCLKIQIETNIPSNRCQAITWQPWQDSGDASPPCFDDNTEVLTFDGWKFFKEVTYDDKIASLLGDELIYQHPTNIISYDYNGKMISCKGNSLNFKVTPNHNMYISPWNHKKFELTRADNLPKECYFKSNAIWKGIEQNTILIGDKIIKMDSFLRFLAIYLADGSFTYKKGKSYKVRFTTKRNIKLFKEILNNLSPDYNILEYDAECNDKNIGCVLLELNNKDLVLYVSQFGKSKNKFIPRWVMNLSSRQINIFLSTAIFCDSRKRGKTIRYNTTSKQLANDFQELILKSGFKGSCNIWKRNDCEYYEVKMAQYKNGLHLNRDRMIQIVNYNGTVSCVEVPNHIIYTRRNGNTMWCGNCLQRIWIRYLKNNEVELFLSWRSRDLYTAYQANLIAIVDMLNREVIHRNECKIVRLIDFMDSLHIYHSDLFGAEKVKLMPPSTFTSGF
jgi:thymidylate synthase